MLYFQYRSFNPLFYVLVAGGRGLIAANARLSDNALQMQRKELMMKNATFPSLRVESDLREAAEKCLREGETISGFVEQSIRDSIERRRYQDEFIARGLVSRDEAKQSGIYVSADDVVARLQAMLAKKKAKK